MLQYILETLAFQLAFLVVYDLFLKKETFFQWNRAYLLLTFLLSLVLPKLRLEALKTTVSAEAVYYPNFLWSSEAIASTASTESVSFWEMFTIYEWIFLSGAGVMALWLLVKLYRIQKLKREGRITYFPKFTKITVQKSNLAFSFFKQVFLGDAIPAEKEPQILAHEMVHIKQWHSLDLLFFELMRIALWFNPLVFVYQNRLAALHEFIADAKVAKHNKREQYQLLLSEAFQTQNLSFVNQFFKKSLIKKRIVMLTKEKSKAIYHLKYTLLVPLVFAMLVYSSCEKEVEPTSKFSESVTIEGDLITFKVYDLDNLSEEERLEQTKILADVESEGRTGRLKIMDSFERFMEIVFSEGVIQSIDVRKNEDNKAVPFALIDEVPIFPGCEEAADKKACFQEKVQAHIRKHFNYPQEAQDLGIQGRVSVMFTIDEAGNITNIRKRGPHELLENETVRIVERLPKMTPGKQGGEVVKVPFSIPVTFRLESGIDTEIAKFSERDANWLPFATVDIAPIFPGCENAADPKSCFQEKMIAHVKKHFNYPKEAQEKGVQGRVAIMFTIDANGNISDIKKRGPSPLLENEAERIVKRLPKMKPAMDNGQIAEVVYSIPITFKLK